MNNLHKAKTHAMAACAALIPAAAGGKDGDGRQIMSITSARETAINHLRKALELLENTKAR